MNFFKKIYTKILNNDKYREFKSKERNQLQFQTYKNVIENKILQIQTNISKRKKINFLHSGHCGDVISSLPVIKHLSNSHECNLFINIGKKMPLPYFRHPAGNVLINQKLYGMIEPLLKYQKYINQINIYKGEDIDVDLDLFRAMPVNINFNQARWYFHVTGIHADLSLPYIDVGEHEELKGKIIFHRTFRYRNNFINFEFLKDFEDMYFVGTKDEFYDARKVIKKLNFYDCKDFLEMASIIKSSKFFIGNSSVAFPIAEALKVPRLLEACPDFPVLQISGKYGYDFYYQPHFEKLFNYLNKKYTNKS